MWLFFFSAAAADGKMDREKISVRICTTMYYNVLRSLFIIQRRGMKYMEEIKITEMNEEEQVKYAIEQMEQGKSQRSVAEELGMVESTLRRRVKKYKESLVQDEQTSTLESQESTQKEQQEQAKQVRNKQAHMSNPTFTESEIKVIKDILKERERDMQLFHEYRIYKELERVPVNGESVRSAFNMSKETTERLRTFASVRRIPLQDLVELSVIRLLDEYDK